VTVDRAIAAASAMAMMVKLAGSYISTSSTRRSVKVRDAGANDKTPSSLPSACADLF
jgi:hypothetical protein